MESVASKSHNFVHDRIKEEYLCVEITEKRVLEEYFRENDSFLHAYEIGDLDDFFWPYTKWYSIQDISFHTKSICLVYRGTSLPVLLAFGSNAAYGKELLKKLVESAILPNKFYSHLSVGFRTALEFNYQADDHGRYWKMGLTDNSKVEQVDTKNAVQLMPTDFSLIQQFYDEHYPGNWFDQRMLDSLQTFGIFASSEDDVRCYSYSGDSDKNSVNTAGVVGRTDSRGALIAIAGIHVFSRNYRVASLGNIAVHSLYRGKGLARCVTAALVKSLLNEGVQLIGLNVSGDNAAAISCYRKLGFEKVGEYDEIMWNRF